MEKPQASGETVLATANDLWDMCGLGQVIQL